MIAVLDYRAGNLASVIRALAYLGYKGEITRSRKEILKGEKDYIPRRGRAHKGVYGVYN